MNGIIREVGESLQVQVRETVLDSMADMLARLIPQVPRPLDDHQLRPVSDIVPHQSLLQSLRDFRKDESAQFTCPEQAILLELMCQRRESVLAILRTGAGKTATILLYAHMHRTKVTVVVLPLSTLHDDFARRAQESGVGASRWTPNRKHNTSGPVLYVSIEHTTFAEFKS